MARKEQRLTQEEITMDFTDHVVVGVDGSSTSIAAAVWARDIARAGHWPLGIVYTQGLAPDLRELLGESGTLMCVESMLAPALVQASRTAAMVVVASRGQGSPVLPIVDAAAEAVLQEAAGPVVVLPSTTWNTLERPLVLGLDAERPSPASIRFAVSVAGRTGFSAARLTRRVYRLETTSSASTVLQPPRHCPW